MDRVMNLPHLLLNDSIRRGEIPVAVIGLGCIGLPLGLHFARAGATVIGVDIDERKVSKINRGICPDEEPIVKKMFHEVAGKKNFRSITDIQKAVEESQIQIIAMPTPLSRGKKPDLSFLLAASTSVGRGLRKGNLVILESTVYPGVTEGMVKPCLEKESGLKGGEDFGLAYCAERIDPGNEKQRIDNTPRVIGAIDDRSSLAAVALYEIIVQAEIVKAKDCATAEMVKLVENVFRDVNIAFANEIALLCEKIGIDVLEVLDAAASKWSFYPHLPGAGVGGTCIPVNPYYLMEKAKEVGMRLPLTSTARTINEKMPHHMVELVKEALGKIGKSIRGSRICILGLAYKGDVGDHRGAPGIEIGRELEKIGGTVIYFDPLARPKGISAFAPSLEEATQEADCVVIATAHSAFQSLDRLAKGNVVIVDGRHVLAPGEAREKVFYSGLGRRQDSSLKLGNLRW